MTARHLIASLVWLTGAGGAAAQTVTMQSYLDHVQRTHPFFQKEQMQAEIERHARDRWLGTTDWRVSSTPFVNYQEPVQESAFTPRDITTLAIGAEAERVFWGNGGRLSLSWQSSVADQNLPGITVPGIGEVPIGPSRFYENRLFATYSYPLMQNRGGGLDRREYELSQYNVDFSEVQALENQEGFLLEVGMNFVDWALFVEQAGIVRSRLEFAEQQLEQTRKRRSANLVDEVDVLRSLESVQGARQSLLFTESRADAQRAGLAVLAQDSTVYGETPDMDLYAEEVLVPLEEALERLSTQRVLRALAIRHDQLLRDQESFEDLESPQLFLSLRGGLQEGDPDFAQSWTIDKPDVSVLLDFSYPLGNHTARADLARSQAEIRQITKEIENVRLNLEAELRKVWIEVNQLEEVLELNRRTIETARTKTQEELRLYNQGRNELTFVIQSRDSEAIEEFTYAQNAATYHKLVLRYREILDDLMPTP